MLQRFVMMCIYLLLQHFWGTGIAQVILIPWLTRPLPEGLKGANPTRITYLLPYTRGGGFSHWHGIRICACLLGHFFTKFGIAIGGFSSETKEPKLHKLGVFWADYCKKHPIWSKLGAFLSKMVYWWVGNLAKNWYRDSQIFEVQQAHPRTILVKEPPRPYITNGCVNTLQDFCFMSWATKYLLHLSGCQFLKINL